MCPVPAVCLFLAGLLPMAGAGPAPDPVLEAERALRAAGLAADGPGLLAFLRQRARGPEDHRRVAALIGRLGDDRYAVREQASAELVPLGVLALPQLRQALDHPDAEVRRRALACIDRIAEGPEADLQLAVLELLPRQAPAGAVAALLAFLPAAADEAVDAAAILALVRLVDREGRLDDSLYQALADSHPARRAAAALLVGRSGSPAQRTEVIRLLDDPTPEVRLRAALGLLAGGRRDGVPALLDLLASGPLEVAREVDHLLGRLAGAQAPAALPGADAASRHRCQTAWRSWWQEQGSSLPLGRETIDPLLASPARAAGGVARQFLDALFRGDLATVQRSVELPLFHEAEAIGDRQLGELVKLVGDGFKGKAVHFTLGRAVTGTEFAQTPEARDRKVLESVNRRELLVLAVEMDLGDREQNRGFLFLRVRGATARVVGLGTRRGP